MCEGEGEHGFSIQVRRKGDSGRGLRLGPEGESGWPLYLPNTC
jgi:hypothetical protein